MLLLLYNLGKFDLVVKKDRQQKLQNFKYKDEKV
jgi:hypothetical protein